MRQKEQKTGFKQEIRVECDTQKQKTIRIARQWHGKPGKILGIATRKKKMVGGKKNRKLKKKKKTKKKKKKQNLWA